MLGILLGKKKDDEGLRPLTEREIQQKLYGGLRREEAPVAEEPPVTIRIKVASVKGKAAVRAPQRKLSWTPPKIKFRFPWRESLTFSGKALRSGWELGRGTFRRVASGWGLGVLIVAALLLGIHTLNAYRAAAMKNSKFSFAPPVKLTRKAERVTRLQPALSLPPAGVAIEVPPPAEVPAPPVEKGFVIQVCTYSREEDATRLVGVMEKENLPAFLKPLRRANGKTFYPVFLGRFLSFREAQEKLKEFRQKSVSRDFTDSFVRAL